MTSSEGISGCSATEEGSAEAVHYGRTSEKGHGAIQPRPGKFCLQFWQCPQLGQGLGISVAHLDEIKVTSCTLLTRCAGD